MRKLSVCIGSASTWGNKIKDKPKNVDLNKILTREKGGKHFAMYQVMELVKCAIRPIYVSSLTCNCHAASLK